MNSFRLAGVIAVCVLSVASGATSHAVAAPVPTLFGEVLTATALTSVEVTPAECDNAGTTAFAYTATGVATGPYPGTFEVTGTYLIGPHERFGISTEVELHETFTISSGDTTITGTKAVATGDTGPFLPGASGACLRFNTTFGQVGRAVFAGGLMRYEATLRDSTGSSTVTGLSGTNAFDERYDPCCPGPNPDESRFLEAFVTSTPVHGPPATVVLSPPDAVNTVGTEHTVMTTVNDAMGRPVPNINVLVDVQGLVALSIGCQTDATGQCAFAYSGPQFPGADLITGCADSDANGVADSEEPCGTATKAWLLPTSTEGQVSGGGQISNLTGSDQVAFGFTARSMGRGLVGSCSLVDPSVDTTVKCLDTTTLVQAGSQATVFGAATVNGVGTTYRIDVDDFGEPGGGKDTFTIQTASGYAVGGVLLRGNVQVHD